MIKIEHWSDYRCPFCYIADAEFEDMMKTLGDTSDIVLINKAFELDPEAPKKVDYSTADVFSKKYGMSYDAAVRKLGMIDAYGRKVGIAGYNYSGAQPVNSFDAHRLTKYAEAEGVKGMYDRLMKAYFVDNVNIADFDTLVGIAVEMGLDKEETERMLRSDRYAEDVRRDEYEAYQARVASVPTYLSEDGRRFAGAGQAGQIKEVILELLQ